MIVEPGEGPVRLRPVQRTGQLRRIDHVGVVVGDVVAAAGEWAALLGITVAHVEDVLDGTVRLAYLDIGNTTLQLVQPLVPGPIAEWLATHGEGLHHICLEVDAIPAVLDDLDDQGARFIYRGGRGADVCFLGATPCGVLVELTESSTLAPGQEARPRTPDPS